MRPLRFVSTIILYLASGNCSLPNDQLCMSKLEVIIRWLAFHTPSINLSSKSSSSSCVVRNNSRRFTSSDSEVGGIHPRRSLTFGLPCLNQHVNSQKYYTKDGHTEAWNKTSYATALLFKSHVIITSIHHSDVQAKKKYKKKL